MQLDRTHVAIRVRTLSEIGDLSLVMIRRYPRAFFQAFFVGAAFWIIADLLLLGWLPLQPNDQVQFESTFSADRFRYVTWMTTLVFLQAPIAGALTTYMLGQSIFEQQISLGKAIAEVRPVGWQLIRVLGSRRLAIPAMVVVGLRWNTETNVFFDFFVPVAFLVVAALIRSSRPFVAEMILLERCPLRSKRADVITLRRRSKALHSPMASELGGRFLAVGLTLTVLLACLFYALIWARGMALGYWTSDAFALLVFFPLALWLIASLSVVVKLLGYLDARIRLEGWEVELAIRAEAIRQFGEDSMSTVLPSTAAATTSTTPAHTPAVPRAAATVKNLIILVACLLTHVEFSTPIQAQDLDGRNASLVVCQGWKLGLAEVDFGKDPHAAGSLTRSTTRKLKADKPLAFMAESPVVADSAWFDAERRKLRSIELNDHRVDSGNRQSRWLPKPDKPKPPATQSQSQSTTSSQWSNMGIGYVIGWVMLIAIVCGVVALVMYVFANSAFEFRDETPRQAIVGGRALDEQTKQRIAELPAELRQTNVSPRSELERLMRIGDFDHAIVFLYGHQLLMLDRVGSLRLSRWKTNNQYLRETRHSDPSVGDQLRVTVDAFERSYFGKHALDRTQFDRLWQENLAMEANLAARGAAK